MARFDGAGRGGAVPGSVRPGNASRMRVEQAFGFGLLALGQQAADRAGGAAGQQEQPGGVLGDAVERQLRLQGRVGVEEADGRQALQVGEPGGVLRQQHDRVGRQARVVGAGERDLAADDRLHALAGAGLAEFQRAEQVAGVGDGDGRHAGVRARAAILSALMAPSLSE